MRIPGDNPFASHHIRPGAVPFLFPADQSLSQILERFRSSGWRGQIVGGHGTGKSTLLVALARALEAADHVVRFEQLPAGRQRLPAGLLHWEPGSSPLDRPPILLLDGAERLWPWSRWWLGRQLRRQGWGLIAAAHRPLGLSTLYRTRPTPELASRVIAHLAAEASVPADLATRLRRRGGDLRAVLFDLYDEHERMRRGRPK